MAAADVRDMLDLPAEGQPRPHKKQKIVEKRPEGITRELYALLGERAPPIAITEKKYKGRPKWMSKSRVRPWQMVPFTNSARSDGLVLRHWQRQEEPVKRTPAEDDAEMQKEAEEAPKLLQKEYPFAKYNVKPTTPRRYTEEEYKRHLRSDDWTKEETDYLMDLVEEYDLRWIVIADRYDYQPQGLTDAEANATALVPAKRYRTMEQMKARYYFVAASMLALERPPSEMSEAEYDLHEKMMRFDPDRERARKELAALQLNRTADEVREEGVLLEELKRIIANEQSFVTERRELYARLEVPISVGNTAMYQSSQGLSQLLQTLLQADKSKKQRRSLLGPEAGVPSPVSQTPTHVGPGTARESRADTPTGAQTAPTSKKGAVAAAAASNAKESASAAAAAATAAQQQQQQQPQPPPTLRVLTPSEEIKYGVQHHDRLAPGVQFRSDRTQKLTQAKSLIQSQKLAAALAELEIPPRLVMPTERVCKEFEKLVHSVNLLLDARKVAEKVEGEIRVLEAAREEREWKAREAAGGEKGGAGPGSGSETTKDNNANEQGIPKEKEKAMGVETDGSATEVKKHADAEPAKENKQVKTESDEVSAASADGQGQGNKQGDATAPTGDGDDADTTGATATTATHKRSASVLSSVSDKSTKRQRR